MQSYWMKFRGRNSGCVEAVSEEAAKSIAKEATGHDAISCKTLPYPSEPRINKHLHPKHGACPSFCFKPEQCSGHTSCPQNYSCTE